MNQTESFPIRGTEEEASVEERGPFFSPDGQWVGFWSNEALKKVHVTGGAPVTLCENIVGRNGASWGPNDTIVFGASQGILQINATGGTPQPLIRPDPDKGESLLAAPQILPDGDTLLFTVAHSGNWDEAQIVVQSLATGERKVLVDQGAGARYVPTGHLIYTVGETLLAAPFDLDRLQLTGGPVSWIDNVARAPYAGAAHLSYSNSGSIAYIPMETHFDTGGTTTLAWMDRLGSSERMAEMPVVEAGFPRISPDGRHLAVAQMSEGRRFDIWIHDLERGTRLRITHEGGLNAWPVWSPDGTRLAFTSNRLGTYDIFWKTADGSGEAEPLLTSGNRLHPNSWSSDGRFLTFWEHRPEGRDIGILPLEDERKPQLLVVTRFNEWMPTLSPDGRWLAYVSDESGQAEVYIQPFPGPGGKQPVSTGGGREPVWSSDGRELFYANGEQIFAVAIESRVEGSIGKPRFLLEIPNLIVNPRYYSYDVSPDGRRFVVVKRVESDSPAQINFILNGFEELTRLVPPGN
jgi:serine/threonine-protein kinase